jgi:hypothetical protein
MVDKPTAIQKPFELSINLIEAIRQSDERKLNIRARVFFSSKPEGLSHFFSEIKLLSIDVSSLQLRPPDKNLPPFIRNHDGGLAIRLDLEFEHYAGLPSNRVVLEGQMICSQDVWSIHLETGHFYIQRNSNRVVPPAEVNLLLEVIDNPSGVIVHLSKFITDISEGGMAFIANLDADSFEWFELGHHWGINILSLNNGNTTIAAKFWDTEIIRLDRVDFSQLATHLQKAIKESDQELQEENLLKVVVRVRDSYGPQELRKLIEPWVHDHPELILQQGKPLGD